MASIKATTGQEHYITHIVNAKGVELTADEPLENGGKSMGMNPGELLGASLASCTTITLRMYADRKKWPLESVDITIDMETDDAHNITNIEMGVRLNGQLDKEQHERLMIIAGKCPIHRLLTNPIKITTLTI